MQGLRARDVAGPYALLGGRFGAEFFGPEILPVWSWRDGSQLAGGDRVAEIRLGADRIVLAQRNDVDGAGGIGFEVLVGCAADDECEGQVWAPACNVTDFLCALTGELMTDPDVRCTIHGPGDEEDQADDPEGPADLAQEPKGAHSTPTKEHTALTTTRTFTATADGAVWAGIISPVGAVTVTVDPTITHAVITLSTAQDEVPLAEAVAAATHRERPYRRMQCIRVDVPEARAEDRPAFHGGSGSTYNFGRDSVLTQHFGTINGSVTGMTMDNGEISIGGRKIVSGGRVVVTEGARVRSGGTDCGSINVAVQLPSSTSCLRLGTTSADLTVHGDRQIPGVRSVSGEVRAQGAGTLYLATTSGDTEVEQVGERAEVSTVSGDALIGAYSGTTCKISSVSGDVTLTATRPPTAASPSAPSAATSPCATPPAWTSGSALSPAPATAADAAPGRPPPATNLTGRPGPPTRSQRSWGQTHRPSPPPGATMSPGPDEQARAELGALVAQAARHRATERGRLDAEF
ncbi:hypothetical protein ACIQMU_31565, partial [Streptomyces sp. NPDC091649]